MFIRAFESLGICILISSFCLKHIKIYVSCLMKMVSDAKFHKKLTLVFQK